MPLSELDRKFNELAHTIGMERQHSKLMKELLVELTRKWYDDGYKDGFEDNKARAITAVRSVMRDEGYAEMKEKSE